jgi:indole-3-glycerol phosphate synthase
VEQARAGRTVLDEIVAARRCALEKERSLVPLGRVRRMAEARQERRDFGEALMAGVGAFGRRLRVIAELKRASPSRGLLRQEYRPREIALSYERGGASALSVLTEAQYFLGAAHDLTGVRQVVDIPLLRKDFIVDSYQVFESVAIGADALLLIVAILRDDELGSLLELCGEMRIAALVEVHTQPELDRAVAAGARIIGVNNRNLQTLDVDLETSIRLRGGIPSGCVAVSESGIKTAADFVRVEEAAYNAILIGEGLMTQPDPGEALAHLLAEIAVRPR